MTIPQIMEALPRMHLDALMAAFEAGNCHYVEWTPNRFIGVNTDSTPHLSCEQTAGDWREGFIKKDRNVKASSG